MYYKCYNILSVIQNAVDHVIDVHFLYILNVSWPVLKFESNGITGTVSIDKRY